MALFKILSNFNNPDNTLPTTTTQGYCYFDVKTGKWYVDIKTNNEEAKLNEEYTNDYNRMSLNAYKADAAALMTTANTLARYSDTNGKFATSNVTLDASNNMIIPGNLTADGVTTGSLVVNGASIFVN